MAFVIVKSLEALACELEGTLSIICSQADDGEALLEVSLRDGQGKVLAGWEPIRLPVGAGWEVSGVRFPVTFKHEPAAGWFSNILPAARVAGEHKEGSGR